MIYKPKFDILKVKLADDTMKNLNINVSLKVSELVRKITKGIGMQREAIEFSLQDEQGKNFAQNLPIQLEKGFG